MPSLINILPLWAAPRIYTWNLLFWEFYCEILSSLQPFTGRTAQLIITLNDPNNATQWKEAPFECLIVCKFWLGDFSQRSQLFGPMQWKIPAKWIGSSDFWVVRDGQNSKGENRSHEVELWRNFRSKTPILPKSTFRPYRTLKKKYSVLNTNGVVYHDRRVIWLGLRWFIVIRVS